MLKNDAKFHRIVLCLITCPRVPRKVSTQFFRQLSEKLDHLNRQHINPTQDEPIKPGLDTTFDQSHPQNIAAQCVA